MCLHLRKVKFNTVGPYYIEVKMMKWKWIYLDIWDVDSAARSYLRNAENFILSFISCAGMLSKHCSRKLWSSYLYSIFLFINNSEFWTNSIFVEIVLINYSCNKFWVTKNRLIRCIRYASLNISIEFPHQRI